MKTPAWGDPEWSDPDWQAEYLAWLLTLGEEDRANELKCIEVRSRRLKAETNKLQNLRENLIVLPRIHELLGERINAYLESMSFIYQRRLEISALLLAAVPQDFVRAGSDKEWTDEELATLSPDQLRWLKGTWSVAFFADCGELLLAHSRLDSFVTDVYGIIRAGRALEARATNSGGRPTVPLSELASILGDVQGDLSTFAVAGRYSQLDILSDELGTRITLSKGVKDRWRRAARRRNTIVHGPRPFFASTNGKITFSVSDEDDPATLEYDDVDEDVQVLRSVFEQVMKALNAAFDGWLMHDPESGGKTT